MLCLLRTSPAPPCPVLSCRASTGRAGPCFALPCLACVRECVCTKQRQQGCCCLCRHLDDAAADTAKRREEGKHESAGQSRHGNGVQGWLSRLAVRPWPATLPQPLYLNGLMSIRPRASRFECIEAEPTGDLEK